MSKINRILNELFIHEITSWDDVITNDKYIEDSLDSDNMPDLKTQNYKVKYIPTGEIYDVEGNNWKYIWINKDKLKNKKSHDASLSKTGTYFEFDGYKNLQDDGKGNAILSLDDFISSKDKVTNWYLLSPKNKIVKIK